MHETAIAQTRPDNDNLHAKTLHSMRDRTGVLNDEGIHDKATWAEAAYAKQKERESQSNENTEWDWSLFSQGYDRKLAEAQRKLDSPRTSKKGREKAKQDVAKYTPLAEEDRRRAEAQAQAYNDRDKAHAQKPKKQRIAELHAQYDARFAELKESQTALHKKALKGHKQTVSGEAMMTMLRDGTISDRTMMAMLKDGFQGEPLRDAIREHLVNLFGKNGGDAKALGLKPGAEFTVSDLKQAYRKASSKAHPDKGGSAAQFRAIKDSYDRLLPMAKSPALHAVAAQTGMSREKVAKAVKRRKAKS